MGVSIASKYRRGGSENIPYKERENRGQSTKRLLCFSFFCWGFWSSGFWIRGSVLFLEPGCRTHGPWVIRCDLGEDTRREPKNRASRAPPIALSHLPIAISVETHTQLQCSVLMRTVYGAQSPQWSLHSRRRRDCDRHSQRWPVFHQLPPEDDAADITSGYPSTISNSRYRNVCG